jgi:hypothetical protein
VGDLGATPCRRLGKAPDLSAARGSRWHEIRAGRGPRLRGVGVRNIKFFLETQVPSRVLENPWHRAFLTGLKCTLWKRRIKHEPFGWASTFLSQKVQKKSKPNSALAEPTTHIMHFEHANPGLRGM